MTGRCPVDCMTGALPRHGETSCDIPLQHLKSYAAHTSQCRTSVHLETQGLNWSWLISSVCKFGTGRVNVPWSRLYKAARSKSKKAFNAITLICIGNINSLVNKERRQISLNYTSPIYFWIWCTFNYTFEENNASLKINESMRYHALAIFQHLFLCQEYNSGRRRLQWVQYMSRQRKPGKLNLTTSSASRFLLLAGTVSSYSVFLLLSITGVKQRKR